MSSNSESGGAPTCAPPQAHTLRPRHPIPPGTTDCHCHVFEDPGRYPLSPGRSYTPQVCTLDDYLAMCATLGIERTVQVNASVYGFDNSVTLDVIRRLGRKRACGIAALRPDATPSEIARLAEGGMRGVRLSTSVQGYGDLDRLESTAMAVQPYGWHLQLHVAKSDELAQMEPRLMTIPVGIVFDHLGRTRGDEGIQSAGFQTLLRLLARREDCWVKISSWYRLSGMTGPAYEDMKRLAQALLDARPDRCLWGTNWPHPDCRVEMPNDGQLLDSFCEWVRDEDLLRQVLVDNPARLYGFSSC